MRPLALAALLLVPSFVQGADLAPPRAIDGDTILVAGERMRLWGIDAPELHQTCDGRPVGQWARDELQRLVERWAPIACTARGRDRWGRTLAVCHGVDGTDLGRAMVRRGLALPYLRYTDAYARDMGSGPVVAYRCTDPEKWRHR